MKNPLTPAGIEPPTYRFVAQHLNHCATAVPSKTSPTLSMFIPFSTNYCVLHRNLFIPTRQSYLRIYKILFFPQNFFVCCFWSVFDNMWNVSRVLPCDVRVTPEQNGSLTVINRVDNTKKWQEMENRWAKTRAALLPNTTQDHHRRVFRYTYKRTAMNQF